MKINTTIYFWVIILIYNQASAQDYHPLLGDSTVWSETITGEGTVTYKFFACGDTSIEDRNYKKFYQVYHETVSLEGFVFEDTILKKIYYLHEPSNEEVLLYDFSLNVNDTVFTRVPIYNNTGWYIVDSISKVDIIAGPRSALYLHNIETSETALWIEEVGARGSFLNPVFDGFPPFDEVLCVLKDGHLIYQSQTSIEYNSCDLFLGESILKAPISNLKVFPNPVVNTFDIEFFTHGPQIIEIYLLDETGKVLRKLYSGTSILGVNSLHYELPYNIAPGIYLIEFLDHHNGYCLTYRIVKIRSNEKS